MLIINNQNRTIVSDGFEVPVSSLVSEVADYLPNFGMFDLIKIGDEGQIKTAKLTKGADPDIKLQLVLKHRAALIAAHKKTAEDLSSAEVQKQALLELRGLIRKQVGDRDSILGTVSDASGILSAMAFADIVATANSSNFDEYKQAKIAAYKKLAGDKDVVALATAALTKLENGDAKLTATLKGLEAVIEDVFARSTGVADILEEYGG